MAHNKMYRQIKGYEEAMDYAFSMKDDLDEVVYALRYGYPKEEVLKEVAKVQSYFTKLISTVNSGGELLPEEER